LCARKTKCVSAYFPSKLHKSKDVSIVIIINIIITKTVLLNATPQKHVVSVSMIDPSWLPKFTYLVKTSLWKGTSITKFPWRSYQFSSDMSQIVGRCSVALIMLKNPFQKFLEPDLRVQDFQNLISSSTGKSPVKFSRRSVQ